MNSEPNNESADLLAFSISTLARRLQVSEKFLRVEIQRRRLRATRLGARVLISKEEVQRYIARNTQ